LRPAFAKAPQEQLIGQIATAEPPRLDQLDPHLPRDLVTIVHKAMAKDPADRYPTAGALAEDLRRFLDDRPITARRLGVLEQAWRWGRRTPPKAALAAALLALLALAVAGGFWWQRQQGERRERETRARQGVEAALEQAAALWRDDRQPQARAVLEQAQGRLDDAGLDGAAGDDLRRRLAMARGELDVAARVEEMRLAGAILSDGRSLRRAPDREYAAAFAQIGLEVAGDAAAVAARIRESAIRTELLTALDDWAAGTRDRRVRARLLRLARLADPDPKWRDRFRQPAVWRDRRALARLAAEAPVGELSPQLLTMLGQLLSDPPGADAERLLRRAQRRYPQDFWLNYQLANLLYGRQKFEQAVGFFRAALARRPQSAGAHNNLGVVQKRLGNRAEAIDHFRQAVRLNAKLAEAYVNLAKTLYGEGRLDEAIDHFRHAVHLTPKVAEAHYNLGTALKARGRLDEAIDHLRRAARLDPRQARTHTNLGNALKAKGRLKEAIGHYQQALRIDPRYAPAYGNIGNVSVAWGRTDEAIRQYRHALRLDPKLAGVHSNLGNALYGKGRLDEAICHYRQALRLDPQIAEAHCNLGRALQRQGHFAEAVACLKRGHALGSKKPRWPYPSGQWLKEAERLAALAPKLPTVFRGTHQPASAAESLLFAELCAVQKRYAAAARLQADAFTADPKLADDFRANRRYNAASIAALAAAGKGKDAPKPDDPQRACLRQQALDWLRADLAAWAKASDRARVRQTLKHWQRDSDLAGVRGPEALAQVPLAEREGWCKFWSAVAELLRKTAGPR
jgi:serine/threonine-protein kinase